MKGDDMKTSPKWLPALLVPLSVAALALLASTCGGLGDAERLPALWEAPDFALVDQNGDTLRTADLEVTAWVAHFFFTSCTGVCPATTARMAELRDSLARNGLLGEEVRLVSISVDPARDTVPVLHEYAARFGGSPPSEWAFLTGSSPEAIRQLLEEGFKVTASPAPPAADTVTNYQVNHSPRLELVDPEGRIRATYVATEPDAVARLRSDLEEVLP
jgi:cytochrome oxidase Cu insertion factor (SCO1/SenC/PrrC family)